MRTLAWTLVGLMLLPSMLWAIPKTEVKGATSYAATNYYPSVVTQVFDIAGKELVLDPTGRLVSPQMGLTTNFGVSYRVQSSSGLYISTTVSPDYYIEDEQLKVTLTITTFNARHQGYALDYEIQLAFYDDSEDHSLVVYKDHLEWGVSNFLLTGDGPQANTTVNFSSPVAYTGSYGIEVKTSAYNHGSHWKLMLFANGSTAAFDGINLNDYTKLRFVAKASRPVQLNVDFGNHGDDSGYKSFGVIAVTPEWSIFELDITKFNNQNVNRSDINSLFWATLHTVNNPIPWDNLSVFIDHIEFLP
jgi:hypothetical protein